MYSKVETMTSNIKFFYLYRDAGNYKAWGEIVFSNIEKMALAEVTARLRSAFSQEILFVADQIHVPEVFLYNGSKVTSDDHCFHEFDAVEISNEQANDERERSTKRFVEEVEFQAKLGWRAFDPLEKVESSTTSFLASP